MSDEEVSAIDRFFLRTGRVSFSLDEGEFSFLDVSFQYLSAMGVFSLRLIESNTLYELGLSFVPQEFDDEYVDAQGRTLENICEGLSPHLEASKEVLGKILWSYQTQWGYDFFPTTFGSEKREYLDALVEITEGLYVIASNVETWLHFFDDNEKYSELRGSIKKLSGMLEGFGAVAYHLTHLGYLCYEAQYRPDSELKNRILMMDQSKF